MHKMRLILMVGIFGLIWAAVTHGNAVAVGPYLPTADTYTDRINADDNHGSDIFLSLNASNKTGCLETTYLWLKFEIPVTSTTIDTANLNLSIYPAGSGPIDLELRSAEASWDEGSLIWNNQTGLVNATVLAVGSGDIGSTASFSTPALATYLNAHQGEMISLVVLADCDGSVPVSGALAVAARENAGGSGASLELFDPTAISLTSLTSRNGFIKLSSGTTLSIFAAFSLLVIGAMIWFRTRLRRTNLR